MLKIYTNTAAIPALLFFCVPALAAPVFIEGVSETGGWYDVNKKTKWNDWPKPNALSPAQRPWQWVNLPADNAMCWAAAGANTLQWWQDRYGNLPAGTPNGTAETTSINGLQNIAQLEIFQTICKHWSDGGSHVEQAWNWWFNGGSLHSTSFPGSTKLSDENSGGYWKDLGRTVTLRENASYDTSKLCETYAFYADPNETDNFKNTIKSYIDRNYGTALSLSGLEGGHAVTLWGYEETGDGLVLYLTDSDDYKYELFKQVVTTNDSGYLCLGSIDGEEEKYAIYDPETGKGLFISEIQGLSVPIPEPSAFGLFAGTLALLSALRRRKRI